MNLDHVQITNFRSINNLTIEFKHRCLVLVGINESGKSNILKALALLNTGTLPKKTDIRQPAKNEDDIKNAYVRFIFKCSPEEIIAINEELSLEFLTDQSILKVAKIKSTSYTLKQYCISRNERLHIADLITGKKYNTRWNLGKEWHIYGNWKRVLESCPDEIKVKIDGDEYQANEYKFIDGKLVKELPVEYFEDATVQDIDDLVHEKYDSLLKDKLPKVFFWEYIKENILPSSVNLEDFINNPDICVPLKNMFIQAGHDDIKGSIVKARERSTKGVKNLLEAVSEKCTKFLQDIWKWDSKVGFELTENGENLVISIKENNSFDMVDRSDGFKRFVTFLLMISVVVQKDVIKNSIILIDEPDISLDPPGTRQLRDELIRISKKNIVVYSTHSIFMIDRNNIDRHIKVKKQNEITSIEIAEEGNIAKEEVLFNALGYSIFNSLNKKNILFEGWDDAAVFKKMVSILPSTHSNLSPLKELGVTYAKGAGNMLHITPILKLAERKCLIVSDSDDAGKNSQKRFNEESGYGIWKKYDELGTSVVSLEDFVKRDTIVETCRKFKITHPSISLDESSFNFSSRDGIWKQINLWILSDITLTTDDLKKAAKKEFKELLYKNIKKTDIEANYYDFLNSVLTITVNQN